MSSAVAPSNSARLEEARVRQTGDVRRPRTDAVHPVAPGPQHRAAGDAEHADVEGPDRGRVARDLDVRQRRTAVPDRGHVGRRAADLDDDAVVDAVRAQRAGDRRRRARSTACAPVRAGSPRGRWRHRRRASPSPRCLTPAPATPSPTTSAVRIAIGRIDALSAAVTARSSSPYSPLSSADVVTGSPSCVRGRGDDAFVGDVVRRERLGDGDRFGPLSAQPFDRAARRRRGRARRSRRGTR